MKPLCSLCKVVLMDEKNGQMECPNCHVTYHMDNEIIEYQDDDFTSSHSDELPELGGIDSGPGIMTATDEEDGSITDALYKHWKHKPNEGQGASSWSD